jgi:kynurenine 3-monooxygenase
MYNYYEMRHAITDIRFLARKKLEGVIHSWFPRLIIPLYTMVSFSTLPYSQAIDRWHRQSHWLNVAMISTTLATASVVATVGFKYRDQFLPTVKSAIDSIKHQFV